MFWPTVLIEAKNFEVSNGDVVYGSYGKFYSDEEQSPVAAPAPVKADRSFTFPAELETFNKINELK
jgi:hypothetical protein